MTPLHDQSDVNSNQGADAQTIALRIIAGLMVVGAAYLLRGMLLPFILGLVLAVALSGLADWLQARGLPRTLATVLCTGFIAAVILGASGLVIYQAGTILGQSDKYLNNFSDLLADVSHRTGGDRLMKSLGMASEVTPTTPGSSDAGPTSADPGKAKSGPEDSSSDSQAKSSPSFWRGFLRRNAQALAGWVTRGIGGLAGMIGGFVVFLAYLFYMIQTRADWIERLTLASSRLGLRPRHSEIRKVYHEIITFIGCISLVSLGYTVFVSLSLWAIGVPQPLLWGVLAGLMEFIPYFGPLLAMILPTIVAFSLGTWWQPAAVVGQYVGLHAFESYVVTPLLYGNAVRINPVTVLFGVLFFGWLWGPLGLAVAMPTMLLLRGLLAMSPDTPALDALASEEEKDE